MINCDQIAVESAKLKAMFTKCYNLKAIDLRSIVDLIESVSACSGGSFNLKTVNGQSLLGIGNIVVTAVVDGTETKVQQGSGITVTGNGSISSPYVVSNSSIITVDGSETKINQGSNITIAGTGTVANPYVINAETQSQTPQVNADWASISGASEILNKPTIPSAQGLQEVINVGGYAEKNTSYINFLAEEDGEITSDLRVYSEDLSKNSKVGLSGGVVEVANSNGLYTGFLNISDGIINIQETNETTGNITTFGFTSPTVSSSVRLPAKTIAGTYTISTLDDIPLEKTGTGVFLRGRTAANYGTPGNRSFDVSYAFTPSTGTPYGAIGSYSFAMGNRVSSNGYGASSFGYLIDNGGIGSFNSGYNMYDRGYTNFLTGIGHNVTSMNATVVGQAANIISESILDFNTVPTKALFTVGNGTIQNADSNYTVLTRSDAFKVRLNGSVEAPSLTTGLIDADSTGKILITKEYLNSSIDLQKVINVGGYAEIQNDADFGYINSLVDNDGNIEHRVVVSDKINPNEIYTSFDIQKEGSELRSRNVSLGKEFILNISDGDVVFEKYSNTFKTTLNIDNPVEFTTIKFPAKTVAGDYTLATTDDIPTLKQVMEQDLNDNVASGSITLYQPSLSSTEYSSESILTTEPTVGRKTSISYADGSITSADLQFAFPSSKIDGNYIIATTDDLDAIDLEKIIDAGNTVLKGSSTLNLLVDDGLGGYSSEISCSNGTDYSILNISTENINIGSYNSISNLTSDYGVFQGNIGINTSNILTGHSTHIEIDGPFSVSTLRFPAPLVDGVYTIDVTPNSTYTVSTLPSGVLNDKAIVTDATAPTYLGVLVGGGSVVAPVWHNGTNWVSR